MDSITRSPFSESPACSNRTELLEQVDPDARRQAESGVDRAKSMPDVNAGLPTQTSITDRVVTASDVSVPNTRGPISQTRQADFSVLYPKLDQLIKKLEFIPTGYCDGYVGKFAFTCGLYPEYCKIKTATDGGAQRRAAFFQKYFEIEGSDAGIENLQRFSSCNIFPEPLQNKLNTVLENIDVEYLPGTPVKTVNRDFDFELAFKHVANRMGTLKHPLAFKLGFKEDAELDGLFRLVGSKESRSDLMIVLHAFAQQGRRTVDLLQPLLAVQRRDLKEELEKALKEKVADLSAGSAPKKVKYDSGH